MAATALLHRSRAPAPSTKKRLHGGACARRRCTVSERRRDQHRTPLPARFSPRRVRVCLCVCVCVSTCMHVQGDSLRAHVLQSL